MIQRHDLESHGPTYNCCKSKFCPRFDDSDSQVDRLGQNVSRNETLQALLAGRANIQRKLIGSNLDNNCNHLLRQSRLSIVYHSLIVNFTSFHGVTHPVKNMHAQRPQDNDTFDLSLWWRDENATFLSNKVT